MARSSKAVVANTSAPAIQPRMLVVRDAASYLGIGPWAMRQLYWDGTVCGVMIGRRLLFDKAVLDRYVDGLLAAAAG